MHSKKSLSCNLFKILKAQIAIIINKKMFRFKQINNKLKAIKKKYVKK